MVSYESLKSEYERNWANLQIRPARLGEANATARKAINGKATYQQVERLTGVPWYFVALCHYREFNFDFDTYLGNGETLKRVTCLVPKGRGPFASFVDGAVDALRIEHFVGTQDWCIARTLYPARMLQRPRLSRQGRQLALSLRRLDPLRTDRGQGRQVRRGPRLRPEPCRFPARHRCYPACDDVAGFLDHDRRQPVHCAAVPSPTRTWRRRCC